MPNPRSQLRNQREGQGQAAWDAVVERPKRARVEVGLDLAKRQGVQQVVATDTEAHVAAEKLRCPDQAGIERVEKRQSPARVANPDELLVLVHHRIRESVSHLDQRGHCLLYTSDAADDLLC